MQFKASNRRPTNVSSSLKNDTLITEWDSDFFLKFWLLEMRLFWWPPHRMTMLEIMPFDIRIGGLSSTVFATLQNWQSNNHSNITISHLGRCVEARKQAGFVFLSSSLFFHSSHNDFCHCLFVQIHAILGMPLGKDCPNGFCYVLWGSLPTM